MIMDEILDRYGLKYEDLEREEKDTLKGWVEALKTNKLTVEGIRKYISAMKDIVEQKLEDEPEFIRVFIFRVQNRNQIMLKARLKNYRLMEAFLATPERAKEALERSLANIVVRR